MRKIIVTCIWTLTCLFAGSTAIHAQVAATAANPLVWEATVHDFGKIPAGKPVTHRFLFTNQSGQPVSILRVHASCGCTRPKWSAAAVADTQTGYVDATFNAGTLGAFSKTVTVTTSAGETTTLRLKGEVVMPE